MLDGDCRRQAVDLVDIRLLHHLQELARIGREAFDITALAFGIDRIEGKRRLARAGKAGHDDQLVARQIQIDALEVMLAGATDGNRLQFTHDKARTKITGLMAARPYVVTQPGVSRSIPSRSQLFRKA